ncbi:hypothetical protein V6N12_057717 [Hibiscus sabdariffa]|uniref:Uncharacterized protein n=1 Tax=Hibiscus sabdariffa TaxID=183260 RepID=A0ABR2C6A8_9ROSI
MKAIKELHRGCHVPLAVCQISVHLLHLNEEQSGHRQRVNLADDSLCKLSTASVPSLEHKEKNQVLEEAGEEEVIKVEAEKSGFLNKPILAFNGSRPRGHPSSCIYNTSKQMNQTSGKYPLCHEMIIPNGKEQVFAFERKGTIALSPGQDKGQHCTAKPDQGSWLHTSPFLLY